MFGKLTRLCFFLGEILMTHEAFILQVKKCIQAKIFYLRLILNFLCDLALIIHELFVGLGDKGN